MELGFYKNYISKAENIIEKFNDFKSILYAIITAKRFYNFYLSFSNKESFGNPELLRMTEEIAEQIIMNRNIDKAVIEKIYKEMDGIIPDSDEFSDCSDAMDSSIIHYYLLGYIINGKKENIKYIANYVYDLCDRYAQDQFNVTIINEETEKMIENNPIVTTNIKNELELLERIMALGNVDVGVFIKENTKDFVLL